MALAETVLRAVHKHGLVPKITKALPFISLFLSVASVLWLLVLPMDGNYRQTYISENALMPGQVTSYFRESEWNIVRGYRNELKIFSGASAEARNTLMEGWLKDIGLKTAYHDSGDSEKANTLYGILHAARGDDTEAIVLSVPWTTSDGQYNLGGASLAVSLARYFVRMSIWSKNIILVFTEDGHTSLRSWVEAYHTSLDKTAGSIEAAVVLEYPGDSDYYEYYELHYEGLNGQLPNLDLLNTAMLVSYHENTHVSIQETPGEQVTRKDYITRLKVFIKGIISLTLAGVVTPTKGCESFSGWQIQAFTMRVRGTTGHNDITQIGRIIDETFRSVNNLLEKFHQSFFFYLLMGTRDFVSIGTYLPAAVLVAVSYALSSLSALLSNGVSISKFLLNISSVLNFFVAIELVAFLLSVSLPFLVGKAVDQGDRDALVSLILASMTFLNVSLSASPFYKHKLAKFQIHPRLASSIIAFSLFYISMVITALLIINFSLALSIGLIALPLTFVPHLLKTTPVPSPQTPAGVKSMAPLLSIVEKYKPQIKLAICLFVSNPFFIIYIIGNLYLKTDDYENGTLNIMSGLITSWNDLQCWTWFVVMLGWFPSWLAIGLCSALGNYKNEVELAQVKKDQ